MLYSVFIPWLNVGQTPIVDVISPIVFVCQLFLSNLMYFVILGSISPNLWHNPRAFRAINGRRSSLSEPSGRRTEVSHTRNSIARANRYCLRSDTRSGGHSGYSPARSRCFGKRRRATAFARRRRLTHIQHQFSAFLRGAGTQQSSRKTGHRARSRAPHPGW